MDEHTDLDNRTAALINELIGTRDHLLAAIRNHRAQKGFNGKISGDDHRLWEAAGLGDAGWADIPGDM
jgi:hypothetical protein